MMNKFFLLAVLMPFTVFSQIPDTSKTSHFLVGISGGMNDGYRHLSAQSSSKDNSIATIIANRNANEKHDWGYCAGIEFQYVFNRHFSIRSGINFNQYNFKTKTTVYTTVYPDPSVPKESQAFYGTSLLELPVKLGYTYTYKKLGLHASLGPGLNYFSRKDLYRISQYSDGSKVKETLTYGIHENKLSANAIVSVGINYRISRLILLRLEPTFKYMLSPLNSDPISTRLYSYNLILGIMFQL